MLRRLLPLLAITACASKGGQGARGQGEAPAPEVVVPDAPQGGAWRTARGAPWKEMLEDLAEADVVFVSAGGGLDVAVLDYMFKRGRLHAVAVEWFPRTAQRALDDFSFGRIDEAELAARAGGVPDAARPVLAFARERALPVLGLGLEQEIRQAVQTPALMDGLTEEQRRSLPALPSQAGFDGPTGQPQLALVRKLDLAVAADVLVRWYRGSAPEKAQVAVLAATASIAPRERLPEVLFGRSGKSYRTVVEVPGPAGSADPAVFAKGYADYLWFTGE
jgi:hypothetical protein